MQAYAPRAHYHEPDRPAQGKSSAEVHLGHALGCGLATDQSRAGARTWRRRSSCTSWRGTGTR